MSLEQEYSGKELNRQLNQIKRQGAESREQGAKSKTTHVSPAYAYILFFSASFANAGLECRYLCALCG